MNRPKPQAKSCVEVANHAEEKPVQPRTFDEHSDDAQTNKKLGFHAGGVHNMSPRLLGILNFMLGCLGRRAEEVCVCVCVNMCIYVHLLHICI